MIHKQVVLLERTILFLCISGCILMVLGCSIDPEEKNVRDAITKHFESRGYRVVKLEVEKIENFPLGKREYMAPKKYYVNIPYIELMKTDRRTSKNDMPLTFKNAVITIRSTENFGIWMIDNIQGIPLT